jgi:tetratricopeptide (TPR) repeat protein
MGSVIHRETARPKVERRVRRWSPVGRRTVSGRVRVLCALLALLCLGPWPAAAAVTREDAAAQEVAADPARQRDELLLRLELGLQAEVIELGLPLVSSGGSLAADGAAVAAVARALFLSGAEERAADLLAAAPVPDVDRAWIVLEQARIALLRDDLEQARRLLQTAAGESEPVRFARLAEPWLLLARVYARSGRLDLAAPLARRALELAPLHPEAASAWHLLSQEAVQRRDGEDAAQCLARSDFLRHWHEVMRARRLQMRADPSAPLPRFGLALGWLEVEQYELAAAELEELLRLDPTYCRAYFQLGEARRLGGQPEAAIEAYGQGLVCDPSDMRLRQNRGLLHRLAGRDEAARDDFLAVCTSPLASDPLYLGAHLELARVQLALGELDAARSSYERYRALGGDQPLEG